MCVCVCVCSLPLQVVHSSLKAMVPREVRPSDPELAKPEEEEVERVRWKWHEARRGAEV